MKKNWYVRALLGAVALASLGIGSDAALAQADALRVGVATLPPSRGMPHSHAGAITNYTYSAVFDFLSVADEKGDMVPALATAWRSVTPVKWEFDLRPNTKFSNGEVLTSAMVADVVNWYLTDEGKSTVVGRAISRLVKGARIIDGDTVEVETIEPNPIVPALLFSMHVFEPKYFKDRGMDAYGLNPVGTGPFKVTKWTPEAVEMEAFTGSWRPPKLAKLTVTPIPETTARVQALLSGQIDLAPSVSIDSVKQIEAAGLKADLSPAPYVLTWAFLSSYRDTPFKDVRVRRAANMAINRRDMIDGLLLGKGEQATQPATSIIFGYNPNVKPYAYDPDGAKKLLAEAGYPNGFEMDAVVIPGNFPADSDIYQKAAADLGKVGIKTNLRAITFAEFVKVITAPGDPKDYGKGWGEKVWAHQQDFSVDVVPDASFRMLTPWGCRRPVPFWCDAGESALLDKSQLEFDVEKRRKILQDLMALFHDNAPALSLVQVVDVVGRSAKVQNAQLVYRILSYDKITKTN